MCCSPWGCRESDTTERLNWTYSNLCIVVCMVVRIFISLMPYDVKHISICLFVFYISSLVRYLLRTLAILNWVCFFFFLFLSFKSSFYILNNDSLWDMSFTNVFLPVCGLSFHSPDTSVLKSTLKNLSDLSFFFFFFGNWDYIYSSQFLLFSKIWWWTLQALSLR